MVRGRLTSNPQVLTELEKESDENKDLETIRFYLESELRQNKDFREGVKRLYDEIHQALENEGQNANITNFYGNNAFQANKNKGTINNYNSETMTVNAKE